MNRAAGLRLSLLVSMGLVPIACGGTTLRGSDEDNAGTTTGGSLSKGGTGNAGTKVNGGSTTRAGSPSKGGYPSTGGTGPTAVHCTSPQTDPISGLVTCAESYAHRPKPFSCDIVGGAPAGAAGGGGSDIGEPLHLPRADGSVNCGNNPAVCHAFEYGYCGELEQAGFGGAASVCFSGCVEDADCGPGRICLCSGNTDHGGECVQSSCKSDADCGKGLLCASYGQVCSSALAFACQKPDDECLSDADCPQFIKCAPEDGPRICDEVACGRPFLVDSHLRVAATVSDKGWLNPEHRIPRVDHLTTTERAALAAHWTKMGQMEHASIAAFARFSLQLLSLGAPPELVEACTAALADETAHTQLCFGIASAYAGRAIGPGRLDISDSLEVTSLADIVDLVIAEGCFGESSAALEALEAADTAADPVIRAAYSRIAADEQRHAELAFRFVRWALARARTLVVERIQAALGSDLSQSRVARSVVEPCLSALVALAQAGGPSCDSHEVCRGARS